MGLLGQTTNPADMILQGLVQRGLPQHVAQGFVMNMRDESNLNPGINEAAPIVPGSRGGFGLSQWTGPRRRALEQFAASRGVPVSDMNTQLDFLMTELQGPESRAAQSIFAAPDAATAADAILRNYLRPAPEHVASRSQRYLSGGNISGGGGSTAVMGQQGNDTMAQPQDNSIWRNVPFLSDPDRRARLQIGLEGLTLNPNQALVAQAAQGIQDRSGAAKLNETAQWLSQQPGGAQFAQALAAGIPADQVFSAWMQSQKPPEPVMPDWQFIEGIGMVDMNNPPPELAAGQYQPQPGAQTSIVSGAQAEAMGLDPSKAYNLTEGPDGVEAQEIGSGIVVTVGGAGDQTFGDPPKDMVWLRDATGNVITEPDPSGRGMRPVAVPISGGPQDTSSSDAAQVAAADTATQVITDAASRALDAAAGRLVGGLGGQAAATVLPGSANAELYRQVAVLQSNAKIENLNSMRQQSPTGGALGGVSDSETAMLAAKSGALDPASPYFERDLKDYYRTLLRTIHGPAAGDAIYSRWETQRTSAQVPPPPVGGQTLTFNPATGGFN